jgi:uncharacterized protein (DUF362 family)
MDLTKIVDEVAQSSYSRNRGSHRPGRREFLRMAGAVGFSAGLAPPVLHAADGFRVGVGHDPNAYVATQRAIQACEEWPALALAGKVVVIKPNLVAALTADTGAVTDPEVVRAVVDLALAAGAVLILIVEAGPLAQLSPNFTPAGYDFFNSYDPLNRVRLVDLGKLPVALNPVPYGWIYTAVYAPPLVLRRDFVFINIAKLKTHAETLATMTTKNVFGIPRPDKYVSSPPAARFGMHDRGVNQSILDLNLLRPSDFAIIDGVVGMEGLGPSKGTPVRMDIVLAGRNMLAVDRVGLAAMGIPQYSVRHLNYASWAGLGPSDLSQVTARGDSFTPRAFQLPTIPPGFDPPRAIPSTFSPTQGQVSSVQVNYHSNLCLRTLEVVKLFDDDPTRMDLIRTLVPWSARSIGIETVVWDGRDEGGAVVSPGRYALHVRAVEPTFSTRHGDAIGWVTLAA